MAEREITADDVAAAFKCGRPLAERVATFANLRGSGQDPSVAIAELDLSPQTGDRYERWTTEVRKHLGLPPLPVRSGIAPVPHDRYVTASQRGTHSRYHRNGVTSPDCLLCTGEAVTP